MGLPFYEESTQEEIPDDSIVRNEIANLDRSCLKVNFLMLVQILYECIKRRIAIYPRIPFRVIQHHHFNLEIPEICKNSYIVVRQNPNLNSIGTASQYLAMLHSAYESSVEEFRDFLHYANENIALIYELIEKLCVLFNPNSSPCMFYFQRFDETIAQEWVEVKQQMLEEFINTGLRGIKYKYIRYICTFLSIKFFE